MVQQNYNFQLYTYQQTFLLTKISRFSDDHNSTLSLYPRHPHPHLILTHRSHHRISTTTSYHFGTPTTTPVKQRNFRTTIFLPHTDRTIILNLFATTQTNTYYSSSRVISFSTQAALMISDGHYSTPLPLFLISSTSSSPLLVSDRHTICGVSTPLSLFNDTIPNHTPTIQMKYHRP